MQLHQRVPEGFEIPMSMATMGCGALEVGGLNSIEKSIELEGIPSLLEKAPEVLGSEIGRQVQSVNVSPDFTHQEADVSGPGLN